MARKVLDVSECGVGRLIFPPGGVKIDGDTYQQLMDREVAPDIWVKMIGHPDPYICWWQHDLAPAHEKRTSLSQLSGWPPIRCRGHLRVQT